MQNSSFKSTISKINWSESVMKSFNVLFTNNNSQGDIYILIYVSSEDNFIVIKGNQAKYIEKNNILNALSGIKHPNINELLIFDYANNSASPNLKICAEEFSIYNLEIHNEAEFNFDKYIHNTFLN